MNVYINPSSHPSSPPLFARNHFVLLHTFISHRSLFAGCVVLKKCVIIYWQRSLSEPCRRVAAWCAPSSHSTSGVAAFGRLRKETHQRQNHYKHCRLVLRSSRFDFGRTPYGVKLASPGTLLRVSIRVWLIGSRRHGI